MLNERTKGEVVYESDDAISSPLTESLRRPIPPPLGKNAEVSFGSTFGLDPRAALLVMLVDMMLFGGEIISMGLLVFLSFVVSIVLGIIVFRIQKAWYGDQDGTALTKALIVGLVTAIPTPLTPLIAIPGGAIGLIRKCIRW